MKYTVKVKPGSSQEKVIQDGDVLTVWLHARAHDGEANKAAVKVLAKYFGVSRGKVAIVRGEKSRVKVIEVVLLNN